MPKLALRCLAQDMPRKLCVDIRCGMDCSTYYVVVLVI